MLPRIVCTALRKVELSGRGRRARHTAALTTLKNKEKMKDPGKTVVEGKDCPELLVVTESTPFLLLPPVASILSLTRGLRGRTSAASLHDLLKPMLASVALSGA